MHSLSSPMSNNFFEMIFSLKSFVRISIRFIPINVVAYRQCIEHVNWRNTLNANIITSRENGKCMYIYIFNREITESNSTHFDIKARQSFVSTLKHDSALLNVAYLTYLEGTSLPLLRNASTNSDPCLSD